mmetsp:Transcript_68310/g.163050  ORF Transcript_68310/g.163050 Transcript_68310/m.163050 type:complete len:117 (-) Transcript_68310:72-422(-)
MADDSEEDEDPRLGVIVAAVLDAIKGLPSRPVSLSELAKHRTEQDLWVNVAGHVFDISTLVTNQRRHPGGNAILKRLVDKMPDNHDCSTSFCKFHYPSGNGVKWMKGMYIGTAPEG